MKKKIKYAEFPDMNTVKDIVIFGGKKGADKPQYTFYNFDGEVEMSREIARILRNLADDVECGHISQTLRDVNGNRVGRASLDN